MRTQAYRLFCVSETLTNSKVIVLVLSVPTLLLALSISPASGQEVDIILDKGKVTGQLPMRTVAVHTGNKTAVNAVLMVPWSTKYQYSYIKVMPEVELALQKIDSNPYLLPNHYLRLRYFDSKCDETSPMNYSINAYMDNMADVFFGPCCDFALAPVSRQTKIWDIPVITFGADAPDFKLLKKEKYSTLTRAGPYDCLEMADLMINRIMFFQWKKLNIVYNGEEQYFYFLATAVKKTCEKMKLKCEPTNLRDQPEPETMLKKLLGLDYSGR
ncbi:atrial natriuretic peptide receptor 3-like [Elysia marginata]|uniref:Atrial natriuretic peptide receptor 3-like n=1 Tax=Elysia marginata TaxID=1093978 RepID=A0AAV4GXL6_9GAST|nr:atrial natriuretic peptide receptor 3-like [Elysia marginata]